MVDFKKNKVKELPDSAYYIPHFITPEEESELTKKIYSAPKPKWKTLSNRRLQNWGGLPHPKGMIQEELPEWLLNCLKKIEDLQMFGDNKPNHVLVNEYLAGQGIMPHEDGPLFYPTIATINIGSHTVLDYYDKTISTLELLNSESSSNSGYVGSLLLERYSLLIVQDDLYSKYLHGIREKKVDTIDKSLKNLDFCDAQSNSQLVRDTRISLTIRYVPHILKTKFVFGIR